MQGRLHRWDGDSEPIQVALGSEVAPANLTHDIAGETHAFTLTGVGDVSGHRYANYGDPEPPVSRAPGRSRRQLEEDHLDQQLDDEYGHWGEGALRDLRDSDR